LTRSAAADVGDEAALDARRFDDLLRLFTGDGQRLLHSASDDRRDEDRGGHAVAKVSTSHE